MGADGGRATGPVLRTGTDIVSVDRVGRLIEQGGERFLRRWFSDQEIRYCNAKARPALHFAARLAAKEAVVKAVRLPGDGPLPWRHVEIGHDAVGAPTVRLSGDLLAAAERDGLGPLDVSLSHCDEFAVAVVVAAC